MLRRLMTFALDDSAATAIEYALIAGLIGIVIITALQTLGTSLNAKFTNIAGVLN